MQGCAELGSLSECQKALRDPCRCPTSFSSLFVAEARVSNFRRRPGALPEYLRLVYSTSTTVTTQVTHTWRENRESTQSMVGFTFFTGTIVKVDLCMGGDQICEYAWSQNTGGGSTYENDRPGCDRGCTRYYLFTNTSIPMTCFRALYHKARAVFASCPLLQCR